MSNEVKIKPVPKVNFTLENGVSFSSTILEINSLMAESQAGLDTNDPKYVETNYSRLAYAINEKYGVTITPEEAFQVGQYALTQLQGLKADF